MSGGAVLEARAVIKGEDRTKAAFDSVKARISAIARQVEAMDKALTTVGAASRAVDRIQAGSGRAAGDMAKLVSATASVGEAAAQATSPMARLIAEQERLTGVVRATTTALDHEAAAQLRSANAARKAGDVDAALARQEQRATAHRKEHIRKHGIVNFLATGAAGYASAHGVVSGIEEAFKAGSAYQHEVVGLHNQGRSPEQIAEIQKRSADVVSRVPTSTYTDNLKVIAETTEAFGSVEHAMEHLEFMQKAMSVLKASGGEHIQGGVGEVGRALAKTFEERFTRPEDFEREAGAMIPAMVASGGVFNPEQLYAFAQTAKSALPGYNMRFLSRIAPSLIGKMGGDRAGTAAFAFDSVISGKARDKKQAAEWMRLGLLDPKEVVGGHDGPIGWKAGAVRESKLASHDPFEWAEKVLMPAMQTHGVDTNDSDAVKQELATLFRNGLSNLWATNLVQPGARAQLHQNEGLTNQVGTADDIYQRNVSADPAVGMQAFKAALENLMVTLSGDKMGALAGGLTTMAHGIDVLAGALKDHPLLGLAAGGGAAAAGLGLSGFLSYKLLSGFGLNEPAAHLDRAATMLEAAAGRLGGPGGAATGAGAGAAAAEAGGGAGVLSRFGLGAEAAAGGGLLTVLAAGGYLIGQSMQAQQPGGGGAWAPATPATASDDQARLDDMKQRLATIEEEIRIDTERSRNPDALAALLMPLQTNRAELQNEIAALSGSLHDQKVELAPDSKATVDVNVKVEPSSDMLKAIASAQATSSGSVSTKVGTSGSTGPSYQETDPRGRGWAGH